MPEYASISRAVGAADVIKLRTVPPNSAHPRAVSPYCAPVLCPRTVSPYCTYPIQYPCTISCTVPLCCICGQWHLTWAAAATWLAPSQRALRALCLSQRALRPPVHRYIDMCAGMHKKREPTSNRLYSACTLLQRWLCAQLIHVPKASAIVRGCAVALAGAFIAARSCLVYF